MCGICGIVDGGGGERPCDEAAVSAMAGTLVHRGPDDAGAAAFADPGAPRVALGHRRLSIIDLSPNGRQPMGNEDGSLWLVCNGEIFNFRELRQALEARGHRFRSRTDSEVILHAYEEYGDGCVARLRGQFAFALWDRRKGRLLMARDHTGIKPLYYVFRDGRLVFASELKAILACPGVPRAVDPAGLDDFLAYEFIPFPRTILDGVSKLPPAHTLVLEGGRAREAPYWTLRYEPARMTEEEAAERLLHLLRDAVRSQLVSDVPLGAFLSGGLDSSTIVALMTQTATGPVRTFSIGFEERSYDELSYARTVARAFGTAHEEFTIRPEAVSLVETLVRQMDDPIADFSIFPTYLVSRMARRFVTVALTGDGGDEIFAGYDTYVAQRLAAALGPAARLLGAGPAARLIAALPPSPRKKGPVNRLKRFAEGLALPPDLRHFRWMVFLSARERQELFTADLLAAAGGREPYAPIRRHLAEAPGAGELDRQLYADLKTYLTDNCLVKVDRMSMACSLEVRVPLLDHAVIEFMATVPPGMKLKGLGRKYILRRALSGVLPAEILRRGKEGFSIPMKNWLRGELRPMMCDLLSDAALRRRGYFRPAAVARLVREHLEGRANHSHRLWALMLFERWAREFLDR
ncbi:MAG: asparagine synthase (glutamine-hydrolyzing) [bacterium]|nr:asparagine synthase (glutamine-hydrolyzing) [bacterium]